MPSSPSMQSSDIAVALVEDQPGLRDSLTEILAGSDGLRCVGAFANAEDALARLPDLKPAVVFMDINLPGMDGVACVRKLMGKMPATLVVMLTIYDNTDAIFSSLEAGAIGYLHKPVRGRELVKAVHDAVNGGSPMSARIARLVVQKFNKPQPVQAPETDEYHLTAREREVLDLLVQGFLYKEIADQLQISGHTVHFHIRHIYSKLQVRSRAQAVAKIHGQ
ncbi:MAG: response regulator transcription factor [Verrucomicrobiota bacterium JB025]|nr:response regulator transcription factor [Verrucomicrobiota bacterium JB025]